MFTDAQGRTNIPVFKSSGNSSGNTNLFDLGIRHAMLNAGQAFYNNRESDLQADLQDLEFAASFNPLLKQYSGQLSYSNGRLSSGALQQIPHSLNARFEATPAGVRLTQAQLISGSSQLTVVAELKNYNQPEVTANYDALLDAGQLQQLLKNPSVPSGTIRASGVAHYQHLANTAMLDSLDVKGVLSSDKLRLSTPTVHTEATNLLAHYSLETGNAVLQDLHLSLLGGSVQATGRMSGLSGDPHYQAQATLHGLSLRDLNRATRKSEMPAGTTLDGAINGEVNATGGKTFDDLVSTADLTVNAGIDKARAAANLQTIPVDSVVHAKYMARANELSLTNSYLRTPKTTLILDGTVSNHSNLNVDLEARDLHEVEKLAVVFQPPSPNSTSPLALSGTASFKGAVHGSTTAPRLTGNVNALNVSIRGTVLRQVRSAVDIGPSGASLSNAEVQFGSRGRIGLDAQTALSHWSFLQTSPLKIRLVATDLSLADLCRIAGSQVPVTGMLNANLNVHGTEVSPQGEGSVSLRQLVAYQQPVDSARLVFSGAGDEVHGDLALRLLAGEVQSQISIHPRLRAYSAQLNASGLRSRSAPGGEKQEPHRDRRPFRARQRTGHVRRSWA